MTKFGWQLTASNILPAEILSTIHIILNEPGDRTKVQSILRREGYTVQSFEDGEVLLKSVSLSPPDVILIGVAPPGVGSLEILSRIRHLRADSMIILLADSARADFSYRAMRLGAHDVILEPNPPERLNTAIQNALKTKELIQETKKLKNELRLRGDFDNIAGTSPGVCLVMDDLRRLSESEIPVIFRGEAGTG
ncbi:MAG: response regulator [Nitrospinota bacterium]